MNLRGAWGRVDAWMIGAMRAYGIGALRISVGAVFVWFGILKVIGESPVAELVARTVYWIPPERFIPLLGVWEAAVGLGLLFGVALRCTLCLFWLQMAGTFLVLIVRPDLSFRNGNPFLLTVEGEFVIKNLVLIASGLVIGSTVERSARARR